MAGPPFTWTHSLRATETTYSEFFSFFFVFVLLFFSFFLGGSHYVATSCTTAITTANVKAVPAPAGHLRMRLFLFPANRRLSVRSVRRTLSRRTDLSSLGRRTKPHRSPRLRRRRRRRRNELLLNIPKRDQRFAAIFSSAITYIYIYIFSLLFVVVAIRSRKKNHNHNNITTNNSNSCSGRE